MLRFVKSHRSSRYQVHIRDVGNVVMRSGSSDPAVFTQVFTYRQYDLGIFGQYAHTSQRLTEIEQRGHRPLILDLDASNGASAIWFARAFPKAKIVAVEPEPDNAAICAENTAAYDVEVLQAAIGGLPGSAALTAENREPWAVSTIRSDDGPIRVVTIDQIIDSHGDSFELFLVKIDIEGFEGDLFAHNTGWVHKASVIILEPHDWMLPEQHPSWNFQTVIGSDRFDLIVRGENLIYVRPAEDEAELPGTVALSAP